MKLRTLHRWLGVVLSPFVLITAVAGGLLLFRKLGWYDIHTRHDLIDLHNYELVAPYVGAVVAAGLAFLAVTGLVLWLQIVIRKARARHVN